MRKVSLEVIDSIMHWRTLKEEQEGLENEVFVWAGVNYILKMCRDTEFLRGVPGLEEVRRALAFGRARRQVFFARSLLTK